MEIVKHPVAPASMASSLAEDAELNWNASMGLGVEGLRLTSPSRRMPVLGALYNREVTELHPCFEVTILSTGARGTIGVGMSWSGYNLSKQPGWQRRSVGLHADDGKLYLCGRGGRSFGPKCKAGDVVRCGAEFEGETPAHAWGGVTLTLYCLSPVGTNTCSWVVGTGGIFSQRAPAWSSCTPSFCHRLAPVPSHRHALSQRERTFRPRPCWFCVHAPCRRRRRCWCG